MENESAYCQHRFADTDTIISSKPGDWRNEVLPNERLVSICKQGSNNYSQNASEVRDNYCKYFNTTGTVP